MNKDRKLTDVIFKFSDKDVYRCAMLNLNECLSKNECIQDKCYRYKFCAGNNLTHINLYVEKLETALNEVKKYIHSEEFFMNMNKGKEFINEEYFTSQEKINEIILEVISDE